MDEGDIEGARHSMLASLQLYFEGGKREVVIVFDGRTGHYARPGTDFREGRLRALFTGSHKEADDKIIELVRAAAHPADMMVITSDRDIQKHVRQWGAEVVASRDFRIKVFERLKNRRQGLAGSEEYRDLGITYEKYMKMLEEHENK